MTVPARHSPPTPQIQLPPYPLHDGHVVAGQLTNGRSTYQSTAEDLRAEIRKAEAAMVDLLDRQDRLDTTRERLTAIAFGRTRR